jgi:hypothetical protein
MLTREHVHRAGRRMAARPVGALAVRWSLGLRLSRTGALSPDEAERAAAGHALAVLAAHGRGQAGFAAPGVPARSRPAGLGRPGGAR